MSVAVKKEREQVSLGPQPGPQTDFLACTADIAIYGGAAGGGKTFGLLIDPLRHYKNKLFGGVIFRRTAVQIRNEGGLWDASVALYPMFRAKPRESFLEWRFPSGMAMSFANLEHEKDVLNYQGSEMPWIGLDELTHFSEYQFFYLTSRNRSTSGVKSRIRATCNPDPDSWVARFIAWWIGEDGYPIPERAGKVRWFVRINGVIHWANSEEELYKVFGKTDDVMPTSVSFIPSKLENNQILMKKDPSYRARLLSLPKVEQARLLGGNWKIKMVAGEFFKREWFPIVDAVPGGWTQVIRFWDRAATKVSPEKPDPDWTRGLLLYKYPNGTYCIGDLKSARDTPGQIEELIKNTATHDGMQVAVWSQQDPGSAGVAEAEHFVKMLAGFDVHTMTTSRDKATRAKPVSAQAEWHNILVKRAPWNEPLFTELENFHESMKEGEGHDDIVDVLSGAFNELSGGLSFADALWSANHG